MLMWSAVLLSRYVLTLPVTASCPPQELTDTQLLLDCEVEDSASLQPSSLLDHLTEGLVTELDAKPLAKQYIPSLLVSQAGTHMLESILALAPQPVFDALWELYFVGKLGRLAGHPMGNYVVAKGVGRLGVEQVQAAVGEVQGNAGGRGLISMFRFCAVYGDGALAVFVVRCEARAARGRQGSPCRKWADKCAIGAH